MSPNRVAGMFASGTTLYFADKTDGHLYSAQLTGVGGGTLPRAPSPVPRRW